MRIKVLGTGDTIGTPKIGCECENCLHAIKTGNGRLRTSFLIETGEKKILIDTSPDLRQQLLRSGSPSIDAVIWTHGHYDHFAGFNEFYRVQKFPPAYAAPPVMDYLKNVFHFLRFDGISVPVYEPFELCGLTVTLVEVNHPPAYTCGVVIEHEGTKLAYTADTTRNMPEKSLEMLSDADLLFLDGLMPSDVHIGKHMNYGDACSLAGELNAKDFRIVHMSHRIGWDWPHVSHDGETFQL